MKLKDVSFLIRVYSVFMSNDKVRSPLTDMINIFLTLHEIVFRIKYIKKISINEIKKILMLEHGLRKLFRINEIKIIMPVTGVHNKATY
jgi:hypothetical protein